MKKILSAAVLAVVMLATAQPVPAFAAGQQKEVHASTYEELEAALASDTKIILEGKDYVIKHDTTLELKDLSNVTIQGTKGTRLLNDNLGYAVVGVYDCTDVTLDSIVMGHSDQIGTFVGCGSGVMYSNKATNLRIKNCDLFGCGLYGYSANSSQAILENTIIRDCSDNAGSTSNSEVDYINCTFARNGYADAAYMKEHHNYNEPRTDTYLLSGYDSSLVFTNCTFTDNKNPQFCSCTYDLTDCTFNGNQFDAPSSQAEKYIYYDEEPQKLHLDMPYNIRTVEDAVEAVNDATFYLTDKQKSDPDIVEQLVQFAEEVGAKVNMQKAKGRELQINAASVPQDVGETVKAVEKALIDKGIQPMRKLRTILSYEVNSRGKDGISSFSVKADALPTSVDTVRVIPSDRHMVTFSARKAADFSIVENKDKTVQVDFALPTDNLVTVSFPGVSEKAKYTVVVDENGNPVGGKYNPSTKALEAKLSASGVYDTASNEKDFDDIKDKSLEMRDAIKLLASRGIINGTTKTQYSPDKTISRAEVTALLMRTLALLDPNEDGGFSDVSSVNWYFGAAGSAKKHSIINGYDDNTFRGDAVIAKDQIIAVSARILKEQMGYYVPADIADVLSAYSDAEAIRAWAQEDVAIATVANLVVRRTDRKFAGGDSMKRGDAAVIIKRLFDKLW